MWSQTLKPPGGTRPSITGPFFFQTHTFSLPTINPIFFLLHNPEADEKYQFTHPTARRLLPNLHASQIYPRMGEGAALPLPYADYLTGYFSPQGKHKNTYSAKASVYLRTSHFVPF